MLDRVDSTSTRLKAMAAQGAPEGTVLVAEEQTGGRGTQGRVFYSPRGEGLYLSVLLRPRAEHRELLTLTGRTAVAVCRALEAAAGAPVEIKWLNDVCLGGKKLCGILTETSLAGGEWETGYVVIGIGVNVSQSVETFRAQGLGETAVSLGAAGYSATREALALCILRELETMYRAFPGGGPEYLEEYRRRCTTVGRRAALEADGQTLTGTVLGIDEDFALLFETDGGERRRAAFGTVRLL